jgi:hypothetical protein
MRLNKKEVIKLIKEAMTTNLNLHGDRMLEPEEVVFHYLSKEDLFLPDKVYGLKNNIATLLETMFEIERYVSELEEQLDFQDCQALNTVHLSIRDLLKTYGKGI